MKISIAMATYNGAKYLQEQLDSFAAQTWLPDELVVSDDGSTDETTGILERFSEAAPFRVQIFRNPRPVGVRANFSAALERCGGDYIFLSDQDDVWFPEKIKRMLAFSEDNDRPLLTVCDTRFGSADLTVLGGAKLDYVRKVKGRPEASHIMGCCTMITREFAELALPIPDIPMNHDNWLHDFAERLGGRYVMNDVLQLYRRHGTNVSQSVMSDEKSYGRLSFVKSHLVEQSTGKLSARVEMLVAMRERLNQKGVAFYEDEVKKAIEGEIRAVENRLSLAKMGRLRRVPASIKMLWTKQYRYFSGFASWAKDLLRAPEKLG